MQRKKPKKPDLTAGFAFSKVKPVAEPVAEPEPAVLTELPQPKLTKPRPPLRSEAYKAYIRPMTCIFPGCGKSPSDPHHHGPRAVSRKTHDLWCVPLCREHHNHIDKGYLPGMTKEATNMFVGYWQAKLIVQWLHETGACEALYAMGLLE